MKLLPDHFPWIVTVLATGRPAVTRYAYESEAKARLGMTVHKTNPKACFVTLSKTLEHWDVQEK